MNAFTDDQRKEIGARIRKLRHGGSAEQGMTIAEAAERLDVSSSHLTKAELGINAFSPRFVENVARKFGASLEWLLTGQGEMMSATCEVREPKGGIVVRVVEKIDPDMIADLVMDPKLMEQAKVIAETLGYPLRRAVSIVIEQRLKTPIKS